MLTFEEKGHGETLVLLHGLVGSARSLGLPAHTLQKHGRLILAYLSGHGGLPLTPDAARFNSVVAAVEVSGDTAKSSIAVGSSLSGRTVFELARPGRVRARYSRLLARLGGVLRVCQADGNDQTDTCAWRPEKNPR